MRSTTALDQAVASRATVAGRSWLIVCYGAIIIVGLLIAYARETPPGGATIVIDAAEETRPAAVGAAVPDSPRGVTLPYRCPPLGDATECATRLRATFRLRQPDPTFRSIYMPTISGRLKIWLNGGLLADTRDFRTSGVFNQTEPLLLSVPEGSLRDGINTIEIGLERRAESRMGGFVDRIYVGPDQTLRPLYDVRYCLLKTLPRLAVAWQAALALCLLIVWLGRRNKRMFLTLCIILILGVLNGVSLFMSERDGWGMLLCVANLTNLWSGSLLPGLLAELVGRPVPMRSRWALGIPAAISILFVAGLALPGLPQAWFEWLRVAAMLPWMIAMMGLSIWIVVEAAFRRDDAAAQLLLGGLAVVAMLIVHDLLLYFGVVAGQGALLTRFAGPLMMTLISALLMWRFAMALNEVSRFNDVLRLEVSAAEETLRASFAREQVQVRAAALEAERLRLTRDLHDGLAGQLVSIAAQCELSGPSFRSISLAARRAVDDLRLVVASLDDVGNDLAVMMAQFRERTEPQLKAQGIDLDWQTAELPEIEGLRSEHVLALFRILQEAVGNAARHSGCRMVTVTMTPDDTGNAVEIVVADRGRGGAAPRSGGNGLLNMRRRAESLGAGFAVESGVDGTRVVIRLPRILPGLVIVPRQPFRT